MIRSWQRVCRLRDFCYAIGQRRCGSSISLKEIDVEDSSDKVSANFLIQRLGFSAKSANAVVARVKTVSQGKLISLLDFLTKQGFSDSQISKIVKNRPLILHYCPEKNLLPKMEFLFSLGLKPFEVVHIASSNPRILCTSLKDRLIPSLNFMTKMLESHCDVLVALKRFGNILLIDPGSSSGKNFKLMVELGVPTLKLLPLMRNHYNSLEARTTTFNKIVEKVKTMGFNPCTTKFVLAVALLRRCGNRCWNRKAYLYKNCGWSEEEFLSAFRRNPFIISFSDEKICAIFDYLVRVMGFKPSDIAIYPSVLSMNLNKRIIPRANYIQQLISKGLLKQYLSIHTMFYVSEKVFLKDFVHRFEHAPLLMNLYKKSGNVSN